MVSGIHWESWNVSSVDKQRVLYSLQSGRSSCYSPVWSFKMAFLQHSFWAVKTIGSTPGTISATQEGAARCFCNAMQKSVTGFDSPRGACLCHGLIFFPVLLSAAYAPAECQEGLRLWPGVTVPVTWPAGHPLATQALISMCSQYRPVGLLP